MAVEPFPWASLRRATAVESRLAGWADAIGWPRAGVLGEIQWRRVRLVDATGLARRLAEPSAARVTVRHGDTAVTVQLPWALWRALAVAVLGDDGELAAPRPPTLAERAFAAVAVADALDRAGIAGAIELADEAPAWARGACLVEVAVSAPVAAEVVVAVPATLPPPEPRPLAPLCAARGGRLPPVAAACELARGRLAGWSQVAPRDVVVVGPPAAALAVGRGAIAVSLDAARASVTVLAPYRRAPMSSDDLAHDLSIPVAVVAGDVTLSARTLLELAPGQVLSLGRTLGSAVELRAGARCLARGELVVVDGELGVRVTELVDPAPAVVAHSG